MADYSMVTPPVGPPAGVWVRRFTVDAVTGDTLNLDTDNLYVFVHLGKNAAGADDTNHIKITLSPKDGSAPAAPTASFAAEENSIILKNGDAKAIRRQKQVKLIAFAGAPMVEVIESVPDFLKK